MCVCVPSTTSTLNASLFFSGHDLSFLFSINFISFLSSTMQNEAPTGIAYNSQYQSVAAFVSADQIAFCLCAFYSTHNTLLLQRQTLLLFA